MKKRKILLGLAMTALAAFTLSACDDAVDTTPTVVDNSNNQGNETNNDNNSVNTGENSNPGNDNNQNQSGNTNDNDQGNTGGNSGSQGGDNNGGNGGQTQEPTVNPVITNTTDGVQILNCAGDQESLYAEFTPVTNADSYDVYIKGGQYNDFTKIDSQLTRLYKNGNDYYYRTDAVGLKKDVYEIKVVPVISGNEVTTKASSVNDINVVAYDRTGFAFSSVVGQNGAAPGAYNNDGTLKDNAHVIYLTNSNKSTVKATVAGNEYTGIANITGAIKTKKTTEPYDIRVIGKLDYEGTVCSDLSSWYAMGCKEGSNITVEGIGNDATMYGGGVGFNKCKSIEVRNLGFIEWGKGDSDSDAVQFQGTEHVWVHDNDIFYGHKASGDQAKGDGSVDLKDNTKYMTVSYNHFWDSGKMSLCGMKSESGENYISYHHNWFDHSDSRHPRIRTMTVHVYNNYYDGVSKYGVGAVLSSQCFAEGNYFRNCKDPFLVGGYGTDGAASKSTFSGETKGFIKAYNNHIEGATSLMYANAAAGVAGSTKAGTKDNSDAYLASTRDEVISNEYTNGVAYSNFDTKVDLGVTASQVQSPDDAKTTVMKYAGRVAGGDFKYTFDNSTADTSYDIDNNLSALLVAYTSKMVSVQGIEGVNIVTPDPVVTGNTADDVIELINALPEASAVTAADSTNINGAKSAYDALDTTEKANVTNYSKLEACLQALSSLPQSAEICTFPYTGSFFAVTGNTSTSKGEVTYNGTTYSTCLKMEGSTTITFTTTAETTLTIVFGTTDNANIKLDNVKKSADTNRVLTITLAAGSHTLTKGDSANVFYISIQ